MTTPRRTVRVPDDLWARATTAAKQEGTTVTDVVIQGLQRYSARILDPVPSKPLESAPKDLPKVGVVGRVPMQVIDPTASKCIASRGYHRVGGVSVCKECGKPYAEHLA
jgi:hypothetical protein